MNFIKKYYKKIPKLIIYSAAFSLIISISNLFDKNINSLFYKITEFILIAGLIILAILGLIYLIKKDKLEEENNV